MTRYVWIILIVLLPTALRAQEWSRVRMTSDGPDSLPIEDLTSPSLAIDSALRVHIVYMNGGISPTSSTPVTFGASLLHTIYAGDVVEPSLTIAGNNIGSAAALRFDSSHNLLVLAPQSSSSADWGCVTEFRTEGTSWSTAPLSPLCAAPETYPTVAVAPDGSLHAVYEAEGEIYYARRGPSSAWSVPLDLSNDVSRESSPSIAVGPDGEVHVVFLRWMSGDRRTICHVRGRDGTFTPPVEIRTTSAAVRGLDAIYTWPPFVPSICVDRAGTCHLVFTAVFGTNPSGNSRIFHMENVSGVWSNPTAITDHGTYNRVSITVDTAGGLHVAAECREEPERDWDILYISRKGTTWGAPKNLTALNNADDIAAPNGGRFIESRGAVTAIAYYTSEWRGGLGAGRGNDIGLLIRGASGVPALPVFAAEPSIIDFGTVRLDDCRSLPVVVRNTGGSVLGTARPVLEGGDMTRFDIPSPPDTVSLARGETVTIDATFCPTDTGCFESRIVLKTNIGSRYITLRGCGGAPLIEVDTTALDFGRITVGSCSERTITVKNRGGFPLDVSIPSPAGGAFSLVDPRPAEFRLEKGASRIVRFRFCALAAGPANTSVVIGSNTLGDPPGLILSGEGVPPGPPGRKRLIWLDTASGWIGDRIVLRLTASPPFDPGEGITTISARLRANPEALSLLPPENGMTGTYQGDGSILLEGIDVSHGDSIVARLEFEGMAKGDSSNPVLLEWIGGAGPDTLLTLGNGLIYLNRRDLEEPPGRKRLIWLDTASGWVGDRIALRLTVSPPFNPDEGITTISARLRTGPQAIYLHPPGNGMTRTYQGDGSMLVEGIDVSHGDSIVARLEFEGMANGDPFNPVLLESVGGAGADTLLTLGNGLIRLEGCDVGKDLGYDRIIALRSIAVNGDEARVSYDAVAGIAVRIVVTNLTGEVVRLEDLPPGEDGERTVSIPTWDLPAGFYIMELRDRTQRAVMPIMIGR